MMTKPRTILIAATAITLAWSGRADETPPFPTAKAALEHYIESVRQADLEGAREVMYDPPNAFSLSGPWPDLGYTVVCRTTLSEADAQQWKARPPAKAGDVTFHLWEWVTTSVEGELKSYLFREIDGSWKLVTWWSWDEH